MYNIESITVSEFVKDTSIELPRFQRKKVWKETQNFLLAVSIFKKYPIGVVIINKEKIKNRNGAIQEVKYLLDGRQRLNALSEMYNDPEQIYFWARKYIKFKNNDPESTVIKNTINAIKEYIDETANITNSSDEIESFDASNQEFDGYTADMTELQGDETLENDLSLLLKLIKLAHNGNRGSSTGLTRKFDFSQFFQKISYIGEDNKIISRDLKSFLIQYNLWCSQLRLDWEDKESFIKYYEKLFSYKKDSGKSDFSSFVTTFWNDLKESIHVFIDIDELFSSARIGTITTSNITPTDAQKIFDVINTQGKHLTQAQVLSAKPAWNMQVVNPCSELFDKTKELYNKMQIDFNNVVVKWDVAATFIDRLLGQFAMFWNTFDDSESSAEKKIGYGFKLLAGIYTDKVTQDGIVALSKQSINWATDIDNLIHELDTMYKIILDSTYFKYFSTWERPIMKIISDYSAIDYTLVMYKYYVKIGKPIGNQIEIKDFQKKAFILFDKLIYENLTGVWKGSADNRIARSLSIRIEDNFTSVGSNQWENVINSILDECKIGDNVITSHTMIEPLLYHYYCLGEKIKPRTLCAIDIDHIMPQNAFATSQLANKDKVINNLYNLALLPKKDNIAKSDKRLNEIFDPWLIEMILEYEGIRHEDFNKYSDINNYAELKTLRGPLFKEVLIDKRNRYLNN